ncbi:MAG: FHA domain-containing protein [Micrococcales bacterium]|nr:FHA domain-containing protein [Micrococcales bacterium]
MSELTLTLLRLGLLALLWVFIFSIVGVLRTDIYGTQVSRRSQRKSRKREEKSKAKAAKAREKAAASARGIPVGVAAAGAAGSAAAGSAGSGAASSPAPSPPGRGRDRGSPTALVVTEGPLTGTSLPLRGPGILIGRNPECALVLDDDYASGRHCRIYQGGTSWMVEDLGSTNGTFIGRDAHSRDRLTTPRPVEVGTVLRIGRTVLELRD